MKTFQFPSLVLLALTSLTPLVRAEVSPVSVRVEQVSNDKRTRYDETQKKTLQIILSNGSAQEQAVKVKYYYFAKDVKEHAVTVFKDGEKTATIKPHGTETVTADPADAKSSEKHKEGNGKGGKGGNNGKEVEASGQRIVGYGVQVFIGDKLATEYFSEPSLKSNVGGGDK